MFKDDETQYCKICYELQEQLEAYKMEAQEGKEINAELKSENKHLNDLLNQALKELEKTRETLTEIKEIVGIGLVDGLQPEEYSGFLKILQAQILQKISECEVNDETN